LTVGDAAVGVGDGCRKSCWQPAIVAAVAIPASRMKSRLENPRSIAISERLLA
jgi:hypothetical protein